LETHVGKRHILIVSTFAFASVFVFLAYLFLSNPTVHDTFVLALRDTAARKLNLTSGKHVLVWLSTIPPGLSPRVAQSWVIRFYVTDPGNQTVLDTLGIAGTGWLSPLSFVAEQDGVYILHFNNTVGGSFDKTVSLSYRITQSVYGVPIENLSLFVLIAIAVIILVLTAMVLKDRSKTSFPKEERVSRDRFEPSTNKDITRKSPFAPDIANVISSLVFPLLPSFLRSG